MNRKKYIVLILIACAILTSYTTKRNDGSEISDLIPKGWHILEKVKGDLNEDNIDDIAVIIEGISEIEDEAPNRELLIAFGNKDGTYTLSIKAKSAILRADEGGVWGDPFEGISVDKGYILISFYGGSNWRWYGNYRFRYQDNDWYLIGATIGSFHTSTNEYTQEIDYNLLTGEFIEKKVDENGVMKTTKGSRGKKELLKLEDFIAADGEENIK
ncbi:hypothetical protein [Tepidibacter aestuarii]|uniref:hypothetical protein n=1 Tax=Tepidibacter aestuarii TaxID=2925782 RepID=UPI0020BEF884|nr:hypothetical protein [Tepidibacter aestuarii]CAH2212073.1 protein of unknown function [Tepidibacter aestuarii]